MLLSYWRWRLNHLLSQEFTLLLLKHLNRVHSLLFDLFLAVDRLSSFLFITAESIIFKDLVSLNLGLDYKLLPQFPNGRHCVLFGKHPNEFVDTDRHD